MPYIKLIFLEADTHFLMADLVSNCHVAYGNGTMVTTVARQKTKILFASKATLVNWLRTSQLEHVSQNVILLGMANFHVMANDITMDYCFLLKEIVPKHDANVTTRSIVDITSLEIVTAYVPLIGYPGQDGTVQPDVL